MRFSNMNLSHSPNDSSKTGLGRAFHDSTALDSMPAVHQISKTKRDSCQERKTAKTYLRHRLSTNLKMNIFKSKIRPPTLSFLPHSKPPALPLPGPFHCSCCGSNRRPPPRRRSRRCRRSVRPEVATSRGGDVGTCRGAFSPGFEVEVF